MIFSDKKALIKKRAKCDFITEEFEGDCYNEIVNKRNPKKKAQESNERGRREKQKVYTRRITYVSIKYYQE